MAYDALPNPTGIDWGNAGKTYGQVKFGDDSQQVVLFYTRSVFNAAKSQQMGSRQYENQTWVKMHPPGERLNVIDRPVQDLDKRRFPGQWNMFLQNKTQVPDGTPIDLLFPNNPAIADNLKAFGVHTVQQCSQLSDNAMQTIGMGAVEWKNMAVRYLDNASSGTAFLKLQAEVQQKDQEIRILKRQFEQLKSAHDDLMQRITNPNAVAQNWQPTEVQDVAGQMVNNNHPSQQQRPSKRTKVDPPAAEIEQAKIFQQVTEESFPVIDVTKDQKVDLKVVPKEDK